MSGINSQDGSSHLASNEKDMFWINITCSIDSATWLAVEKVSSEWTDRKPSNHSETQWSRPYIKGHLPPFDIFLISSTLSTTLALPNSKTQLTHSKQCLLNFPNTPLAHPKENHLISPPPKCRPHKAEPQQYLTYQLAAHHPPPTSGSIILH